MSTPSDFSSSRYLTSKRTVDDRSLNHRIWKQFISGLTGIYESTDELEILEVGGGVGATVERIAKAVRRTPIEKVGYTFVELDADHVATATRKLPEWGRKLGYQVRCTNNRVEFRDEGVSMTIRMHVADAFDLFDDGSLPRFNAVIAQAWLDIVNLKTALTRLCSVTSSNGLIYLPINFDGITTLLPSIDSTLDRTVEQLYHETMDRRSTPYGPAGGSETGRKLLELLPDMNISNFTAGSSDWLVLPREDRSYPADEKYFLHHVLYFIEDELRDSKDIGDRRLDLWLSKRRRQIEEGKLIYMAHQLDVLARTA